jgi:hypothetical protein
MDVEMQSLRDLRAILVVLTQVGKRSNVEVPVYVQQLRSLVESGQITACDIPFSVDSFLSSSMEGSLQSNQPDSLSN